MSLPTGFAVRVHDDVETAGAGRVLVGGSPLRAVRLSTRAAQLMEGRDLRVVDPAVDPAAGLVADRLLDANIAIPVLRPSDRAAAAELTVVIPIRDRVEQLGRALAGLAGLTVIVIDDASRDPQAVAAVARARGAEVFHLDHNVGPAAARNIGLRQVLTPYVAFVDSDVQVTAETLLGLTAHFADPLVALVAPQVQGRPVNEKPRWFERYEASSPALGLGERAGVVRPGAAVGWLPSACLVGRTARLTDTSIGGFDARMRIGEDVDLVWRLVAAGQRVRYDPAFEASHDARPTLRTWTRRKFDYGTGGAVLAVRHPHNVLTAVLSPSMGVAALALLARQPWSIPLAALATLRGARSLTRTLPETSERRRLATTLSLRGLGWSLRQESALVLRHWWPLAALAGLCSRRARRVIVSAMVVDVVATQVGTHGVDAVLTFAGRRLDDLAYGAGLWWGALRHRSLTCLKLTWTRRPKPRPAHRKFA
jgi:mycofactocin system glycosyltransferase